MKIAWIISPPEKGSGGFRTICSRASYLEQFGNKSVFYILPGVQTRKSVSQVASEVEQWFDYKVEVAVAPRIPSDFDVVIATAWNTAEFAACQACHIKLYFIQDYEPWFYPMGESFFRAMQSYSCDLKPITIGRWLAGKMSEHYDGCVPYCEFGADLSIYKPSDSKRTPNSICAIYQPEKDRRSSGLLRDAIELALAVKPDLQFYLYGWGGSEFAFGDKPQVHMLGVLSVEECSDLYSKCSLGISLSASNPSRLPFEMLATGLPVVELAAENNSYDFPRGGMLFADPSAEGIASAIISAFDEAACLDERSELGIAFMRDRDLDHENAMFYDAVRYHCGESSDFVWERPVVSRIEPMPFLPAVRELSSEKLQKAWEIASASYVPVAANHVTISANRSCLGGSALKVAIWALEGQEDLMWVELAPTGSGDYCCDVPITPGLHEGFLSLHFYTRGRGDDTSVFLGSVDQVVSSDSVAEAEPLSRCVQLGGIEVRLKFDCEQKDRHEGHPSPNAAGKLLGKPLAFLRGCLAD